MAIEPSGPVHPETVELTLHYTGPEVLALLDSPAILTELPDGSIQVVKAGITATGPTAAEAAAEWGRQFATTIAFPKV